MGRRRFGNPLLRNGIRPPSARPMITHHPPATRSYAPGITGHPSPAARPMRTLPLPAGACPIVRFENPLSWNGYPAPSARPMITHHPPATRSYAPGITGHPSPARTPHAHPAAPRWARPIGRFENPLSWNGYPAPSARPMITPTLRQRGRTAPGITGHPSPAARPMRTLPLPAGRARSVDSRIRCRGTGIRPRAHAP